MIKNTIVFFLLSVLLIGCSKKNSEAERRTHIQASPNLPFQITVVENSDAAERGQISQQAVTSLQNQDYKSLEQLAAKYLLSKERYADGQWKLMDFYDSFSPSDSPSAAVWEDREKKIQDWIDADPKSPTASIAMATFLRDYAWQARGSGRSDTVSDASWKIFGDRLNLGWKVLNEAPNSKEQCPAYWLARLRLGLGLQLDRSSYDKIFSQAINATPDFQGFYNTRAVFLLPRWYGAEGEWEKDLAKSADNIGGDDGDMIYAQAVWSIHHRVSSENVFAENKQLSWERVDRGFGVIEKRFPNSLAAKNERAHLAALAGDKEKTAEYFRETEGKVDLSDWNQKGEFIDCANWAFGQ
jgi:hypothetical protein